MNARLKILAEKYFRDRGWLNPSKAAIDYFVQGVEWQQSQQVSDKGKYFKNLIEELMRERNMWKKKYSDLFERYWKRPIENEPVKEKFVEDESLLERYYKKHNWSKEDIEKHQAQIIERLK